jgi:hypothetical protein
MSVEAWIDDIVDVCAGIAGHHGKSLRAYYVYRKAEFPDAIATFPCVLTFTDAMRSDYSAGGPNLDAWTGICEFHLFPDLSRAHYPECMLYFARIRNAFAAHITLGGKVEHFLPRVDTPYPVRGPVRLQYGEEAPHLGIVVQWQVKENVGSEVTVAA